VTLLHVTSSKPIACMSGERYPTNAYKQHLLCLSIPLHVSASRCHLQGVTISLFISYSSLSADGHAGRTIAHTYPNNSPHLPETQTTWSSILDFRFSPCSETSMFFWGVFPRRQIKFCRRFGTPCQVHL
jgi:hypothetical protein